MIRQTRVWREWRHPSDWESTGVVESVVLFGAAATHGGNAKQPFHWLATRGQLFSLFIIVFCPEVVSDES